MKRSQFQAAVLALFLFLLVTGPVIASAHAIVVVGQDDPAIDRVVLQAAIDAATPGTTIELVGTFQLDGERVLISTSHLTLAGRALDDDGDGAVNEDWLDGIDNDLDGLVDEDDWNAVLRGVSDPTGGPATVLGDNALWNRGLVVEGVDDTLYNLKIRDLRFSTHHRAIELIPEWGSATGGCSDRFFTDGDVRRVTLEGNRFDNNILGVLALGAVRHVQAAGNLFDNHDIGGFFVEGFEVNCPLADGSSVALALSTPLYTRVLGNRFVEGGVATFRTRQTRIHNNTFVGGILGVLSILSERESIASNTIDGPFVGLAVNGGTHNVVRNNTIADSFIGLELLDAGDTVLVLRNHLANAFYGVLFEPDAHGYRAFNQTFEGSFDAEIFLDVGSFENTVVNTGPPVTFLDFGTDNRLIGNFVEP